MRGRVSRKDEDRTMSDGKGRGGGAGSGANYPLGMEDLLRMTAEQGGSDLHLVGGAPPLIRIDGQLVPQEAPALKPAEVEALLCSILDPHQRESFEKAWELDFSHTVEGVGRFRGNAVYQRGTVGAVFRAVPFAVPELETLGLPPAAKDLCFLSRGLVLVTGPTGSGKSTTLAALIGHINRNRRVNIVTVEDPIEFLHEHRLAIVRQREVGTDTASFASALRHVLRHDPDVLLIGEMRDLESISVALTAAETGHLVFSTLHTQTAPLTVSRIVDVFPSERRDQVRQQLAGSLRAVLSQQLVPSAAGKGRVAAVEFLLETPAVSNMIREGREYQLGSAIQTGQALGMQTMDQALLRLVQAGRITRETALAFSVDKKEAERLLGRPEPPPSEVSPGRGPGRPPK